PVGRLELAFQVKQFKDAGHGDGSKTRVSRTSQRVPPNVLGVQNVQTVGVDTVATPPNVDQLFTVTVVRFVLSYNQTLNDGVSARSIITQQPGVDDVLLRWVGNVAVV